MTERYLSIVIKRALVALFASTVLLGLGGAAHAKLIKVTATGTIIQIFNTAAPPFSIGDPFTYEVIVNDDPTLDTNPLPNYTIHNYSPNFLTGVGGSAKLTIGSYTIPESTVGSTTMAISNDSGFSDTIEIISETTGAPSIDGIAPYSFSLKREDFTQTALSSAEVSEGLFVSGGFGDVDAVFLHVTIGGACVSNKCIIGNITNIVTDIVSAMALPESQLVFSPAPSSSPFVNADPASANPIGLGSVAVGGDTLDIQIGTVGFSGPADVYFAVYSPKALGNEVFLYSGGTFVAFSQVGLAPWIASTNGPLNHDLFGEFPLSLLPSGSYALYLAVAPAGSQLATFYFWSATFTVP